ncbi:MAG TPA: YihY/virulence factor BrkB family protein [Gammaproteobacteria bacterium]|nr:YihY/virulence factor BrkB family protein [Gammaproteobacteria bacterium]
MHHLYPKVMKPLNRFQRRLLHEIWGMPLEETSVVHRFAVKVARLAWILWRDLSDGELTLRAMSLVYTTLLALVPLLALSFSVLKGLGVHNEIEPLLRNVLAPLGPKGGEIAASVVLFVDNVKAGVLGSVGLLLLVYTSLSLIQKIEDAFNHIWRVQQPRSLVRRLSGYFSVLLLGPLLMVAAIGLTATLMSTTIMQHVLEVRVLGDLIDTLGRFMPYLMVIAAFTLTYIFIPNTRVRFRPALVGGVVAGVLWESMGFLFASFVVASGNYDAIYSGFAIVMLFMIWLYLSWLILLFGAQIAFYHQNPRLLTRFKAPPALGNRLRERLALLVMYLVGQRFLAQGEPWTLEELAEEIRVRGDSLATVIRRLHARGLLIMTDGDPPGFVPGFDMASMRLADIVAAVRQPDGVEDHPENGVLAAGPVDAAAADIERAIAQALGERSLRDLVLAMEDSPAPAAERAVRRAGI